MQMLWICYACALDVRSGLPAFSVAPPMLSIQTGGFVEVLTFHELECPTCDQDAGKRIERLQDSGYILSASYVSFRFVSSDVNVSIACTGL